MKLLWFLQEINCMANPCETPEASDDHQGGPQKEQHLNTGTLVDEKNLWSVPIKKRVLFSCTQYDNDNMTKCRPEDVKSQKTHPRSTGEKPSAIILEAVPNVVVGFKPTLSEKSQQPVPRVFFRWGTQQWAISIENQAHYKQDRSRYLWNLDCRGATHHSNDFCDQRHEDYEEIQGEVDDLEVTSVSSVSPVVARFCGGVTSVLTNLR